MKISGVKRIVKGKKKKKKKRERQIKNESLK